MKKLLATTAIAVIGMASAASAQSVLERVLGQINGTTNQNTLNGTFANIAENIGSVATQTLYVDGNGNTLSQSTYDAQIATTTTSALNSIGNPDPGTYTYVDYNEVLHSFTSFADAAAFAQNDVKGHYATIYNPLQVGIADGVNGSINNLMTGLNASTQQAIANSTTATEWGTPTITIGDLSTTALGAVNTGDITLGVNGTVDDAKTSTTEAISTTMAQIGGSADTSALVLNIASNMTGVNGSINNTMSAVNGNIGAAATTALGAVNTGTITSGVNAAVQGIVGTSGQSVSGQ
ncbi:MAG: hypothetical protein GC146_05920 [Limimaricola sp.]|uniref:hypothetical protein n=1 Tax=Limimaricola sp. TaxID=2211665 RepID=UPI001DB900B7|nr:hypothetical protein [Limimaricola sp.]MBI1416745.1 hypothetical protein [Limimaricola sp.]